ncbi:LOW QUALITY PROTEIN: N-acetyltransferase ESCO2-like [Phycodurus eques]|uniref:LOW QUALITY PROTEIN: N-acetyltransferase ESCO2-like n=1 Tax=Phycodurus eques TaxID=693459 RepID=UPI002ACD706D|nr:LOW QUALITY PROTEIN: N-acetyltransferase ESCO2-like [Phycodurus eques]
MMRTSTRKRKLSSVDGHPAKKSERDASPIKRRSPRKKPDGCLDKENSPSPRNSPRKAAGFPLEPAVATCSFYGPKKSVYLTPLERKAVKESLPFPRPPSPPGQAKKAQRKNKKMAKGKQAKGAAGSNIKSYAATAKTIKLSKMNWSSNAQDKGSEPKKAITITFSSMKKPKAKIFVGAAFFSTAKKPSSMYKKAKRQVAGKTDKSKSHGAAAQPKRKQKQKHPGETTVQPVEKKVEPPRMKFDPVELFDCVNELPVKQLSSPKALVEKYRLTKELKILLTRTPIRTSRGSSLDSQDDSSKLIFDLSDASPSNATSSESTPPQVSTAVYPIFGSTSKGPKSAPAGPTQPSSSIKERPVRKRKEKHDRDQLIIDAGQKQFGAATCGSCGMVYSADNPEDNYQHEQFHQCLLDSIKFVGWKKERVVAEFWDGKIIMVMPDDPKYTIKKAEEVRRIADGELGFQQVTLSRPSQVKTYLFVNTDRMVVGCLVAESIRQAFRVLEQPDQHKDMTKDDFMDRQRAWCCSTAAEKVLCGVSRVWVFSLARRQGVARRMLDTVRSTFMYGSHLTKEEIAFSDPTPDGKQFATAYCGTPTFLVYNFIG